MLGFLKKIFGTRNEREVRRLRQTIVPQINRFEAELQQQPAEVLRQKTAAWKRELVQIQDNAQLARRLEEILPEAFAVVKNACRRLCGTDVAVRGHALRWEMVPFDVQLIGGYGLHTGRIAEMATGEGKTLVATLPVYLNALSGRGVHVVTVNDYLASRDSEWMGAVYKSLGLTVGCIVHDQSPAERREQYNCDITYGTNSEFGFDYLRDNGMASNAEEQVQRGHYFAIVDEVDSILIDEARTPLIISGPAVVREESKLYEQLRPSIESIVRAQSKLCERYLSEAAVLIKKLAPDSPEKVADRDAAERELGLLLYRAKLGQPKAPALLHLLEEASNLRRLNAAELQLLSDQTKKDLYAQKEELFFAIEEKSHEVDLTEKGRAYLSPKDLEAFVLPDLAACYVEIDNGPEQDVHKRAAAKAQVQSDFERKAERIHIIAQLLKAYCLYEKDVQYVVQENKVIIVDEHTGRLMSGRRWSDGLHQAVEAKEEVEIERETQTYATITIQNYFRLYTKLAGMTGTAETSASEFFGVYKLGVLVIPTNRPTLRADSDDTVFKTKREKFAAVLKEIAEVHGKGRPILVGTASVETSESLSRLLKKEGVVHSVLNAKYHQQEAEIIARAGQRSAVTIATNMAGRGTDIKLGAGVADLGGLHVLSTERHEARRIDRQLRGRCARQGDPGSSHFFLSLEDDLMRLYGGEKMLKLLDSNMARRLGMTLPEGEPLEHPLLNRSIGQAQTRVENHHYEARKRTLEYDDVMNKQRELIYGFRNQVIHGADVRDRLMDIVEEVVIQKVSQFTSADTEMAQWQFRPLCDWVNLNFPIGIPENDLVRQAEESHEAPLKGSVFDGLSPAQFGLCQCLIERIRRAYELKVSHEDADALRSVERFTMLTAIDKLWQEHLYTMDGLRNSIGLRAYGQRDPLLEYKAEAFGLFEELMIGIKTEICHNIFRSASSLMAFENFLRNLPQTFTHEAAGGFGNTAATAAPSDVVSEAAEVLSKSKPVRTGPKVGRNDPCPCGSGKKYKQCCGR
jgi:preprotein translocase subunit SecA